MAKLPVFRKSSGRPQPGRSRGTVVSHRLLRSFLHLVAWIFLLLVMIGNIKDKPVLRETYFLKIDLSDIIPVSVPNASIINSIARTIGLHDFYQVGLWNFCEGYNDSGITHCSKPQTLYYFDPVKILLSELLSGAAIALPADVSDAMNLVRVVSFWMFGLFIAAAVLTFVLIIITPFAVSSRPPQTISPDPQVNEAQRPHRRRTFIPLRSIPYLIIVFFNALITVVASVVATVMFIIFKNVFTSQNDLNIQAYLGDRMMAFMWIASAFNIFAFIVQFASCCAACCGGRKARRQLKHAGDSPSSEMRQKDRHGN